jgi:hypothetical protein
MALRLRYLRWLAVPLDPYRLIVSGSRKRAG